MNNDLAIVIFSADMNDDLWVIDDKLINKYWKNHPPIYLLTETKKYENFKSININYPINLWTKRIRESLLQIPEQYIVFMSDDCFIQQEVNEQLLIECLNFMKQNSNIANINFELSFSCADVKCENKYLKKHSQKTLLKISLLCGLWNKNKLISILGKDCSPWEIEKEQNHKNYDYYILKDEKIISWFNDMPHWCGAIIKGKYHSNIFDFLKKENIDINKMHHREVV